MSELPEWVNEVLRDVMRYEHDHAKGHLCLWQTLVRVPQEVLITAAITRHPIFASMAVRRYRVPYIGPGAALHEGAGL